MKLASTIAAMDDPGALLLDVALSGDEQAFETLVGALRAMARGERCVVMLDAQCEAEGRGEEAQLAASRLWWAVYRDG